MGMEGGTYLWTFPPMGAATEAALGVALGTAGPGIGYLSVVDGCDMAEIGVHIVGPSSGGQLYAALYQAAAVGAPYIPLFTLRAPNAAALAAGASIRRAATQRLSKGTVLRWDITTPATGGLGIFYVKAYPTNFTNKRDLLSI